MTDAPNALGGRGQVGRADLVRALAHGTEQCDQLSVLLSFERVPISTDKQDPSDRPSGAPATDDVLNSESSSAPDKVDEPTPTLLWRAESFRLRTFENTEANSTQSPTVAAIAKAREPVHRAIYQPIAPMADLLTRLRRFAEFERASSQPDITKFVAEVSRGRIPSKVPKLGKRSWGAGLHVVQDLSEHLMPYRIDQGLVTLDLKDLLPQSSLTVSTVCDGEVKPLTHWPIESAGPLDFAEPGSTVLVLGDLGVLHLENAIAVRRWQEWGNWLKDRRIHRIALVPCDVRTIPDDLAEIWSLLPWDHYRSSSPKLPRKDLLSRAERLLALLSFAVVIEPRLLRRVRMGIPEFRHLVELESIAWQHSSLRSGGIGGATFHRDHRSELERLRGFESETMQKIAIDFAVAEHLHDYEGVRHAELLNLGLDAIEHYSPEDIHAAKTWFGVLDSDSCTGDMQNHDRIEFFRVVASHFSNRARSFVPSLDRNWARYLGEDHEALPPLNLDPSRLVRTSDPIRRLKIEQRESRLWISESTSAKHESSTDDDESLVGLLKSRSKRVRIVNGPPFWPHDQPPSWAREWGIDRFGPWVDFSIHRQDGLVTQRMRWIEAGTFKMGSPDDELGRVDDEGPQHQVTISRGFWMFDTPCTQSLWQAVMGDNPSYFKSPTRPVEQVSWDDCQPFLERLREMLPELNVDLPTEAEWEFACRAGSTTALYSGPIEIVGQNNAPALDSIAWYHRNSARTNPVGRKEPNPHGLFDMLGNVWEWCQDSGGSYSPKAQTDPISEPSPERVIRGGSWLNIPQYVRAAYRRRYLSKRGNERIGFRCRVQSGEPSEWAREETRRTERAVSGRSGIAEPRVDSSPANAVRSVAWVSLIREEQAQIPIPDGDSFRIESDLEEIIIGRLTKPSWASAIGQDRFGMWAEFEVPLRKQQRKQQEYLKNLKAGAVVQRLRWIPPGQFLYGSPKDEPGRYDAHEIEPTLELIERGFWMFDTPVTQALWEAVVGSNPSYFKSPTRPVEQVGWKDCQRFGMEITRIYHGLQLSLPSEMEWEYACRAGTDSATYAGPIEILGDANAPILDPIAWYGGNCGVDFELNNGLGVTWLQNKQYEFETGGTHPVALKLPNPWGMYDMLGNVWEWCDDFLARPR